MSDSQESEGKTVSPTQFGRNYSIRLVILLLVASFVAHAAPLTQLRPDTCGAVKRRLDTLTQNDAFLEDLSHRTFVYFLEQSDPQTGLVLDRARADGSRHDERHQNIASIAATGFGLTALSIAAEHGWINRSEARERTASSLKFFAERAPQQHGWFYHWMDYRSRERGGIRDS